MNPSREDRLCLDPAKMNQVLIRLVNRGPTLNDIFPKLMNAKLLDSAIDVSSDITFLGSMKDHCIY